MRSCCKSCRLISVMVEAGFLRTRVIQNLNQRATSFSNLGLNFYNFHQGAHESSTVANVLHTIGMAQTQKNILISVQCSVQINIDDDSKILLNKRYFTIAHYTNSTALAIDHTCIALIAYRIETLATTRVQRVITNRLDLNLVIVV